MIMFDSDKFCDNPTKRLIIKTTFWKAKQYLFLHIENILRLSYLIVYILTTTILHFDFLDRFSDLLKLAMMMGFGHPVQMYSPLSIVSL